MSTLTSAQAHLANGTLFAVTPGIINENAENLYRNGQCLALVRAIVQQNPDFRIVLQLSHAGANEWAEEMHYTSLGDEHLTDTDWAYDFVHAMVATPFGFLLDITGEFDFDEHTEDCWDRYGSTAQVFATEAHLDVIEAMRGTVIQDVELARTFAKTLLQDW